MCILHDSIMKIVIRGNNLFTTTARIELMVNLPILKYTRISCILKLGSCRIDKREMLLPTVFTAPAPLESPCISALTSCQ
jgi:hypothetical protein